MGRIIQQNNGKTTVYVTGENFSTLTASTNTYFLGVDLSNGIFEKKNPDGSIIDLEDNGTIFTGGTVAGPTNFTNGLSANTFSATTLYGDGSNLTGVGFAGGTVAGATNFTNGLTANTFSATTLYGDGSNLTGISVVGEFTGGTVTGATIFTSGVTFTDSLSANTISATTINADMFYGDGSNLSGVVGLTYSDLGFTITSPTPTVINQDVILPYNSTVTYTGTLNVGSGYAVTVPAGTTLTVIP